MPHLAGNLNNTGKKGRVLYKVIKYENIALLVAIATPIRINARFL